jgi:ABC-2 type transport system permease protein
MGITKYTETAKVLFKAQIIYRFSTIVSMIFTVSRIALAYILWSAIFDGRAVVAGFTFNAMITYYIIASFMTQMDQSGGFGGQISSEIRTGTFSKYMVRPMNIFGNFLFQAIGVSAFLFTFNLIAALLWVFVFRIEFVFSGDLLSVFSAVLVLSMGLLFMMQLNYFIGILAFKFLDVWIFIMIKDNLLHFLTGALIPLSLLPGNILAVMRLFPFYYVLYLPAMLFLGKSQGEIARAVVTLVCWNLLFWVLNRITYRRLRVVYDGVGI